MWHKAAKVLDIAEGASQIVQISDQAVALFHIQGEFYAIQNTCPHRGGPLAEGYVDGTTVTCPWHAWQFDVKSGECHTMKGTKQKIYKTKVEKDEVYVDA